MQKYNRNDKVHQRQRIQYLGEAEETRLELQGLLSRPGRIGITVGGMVNVAVSMGFLGKPGSTGSRISSKKVFNLSGR